ncbi:MAG TPA: GNA1162 family protein [Candidatus Binataceae bacterium]|nr:GNA1162 family protein [Candidatus Binataceae bacterium]
MKPIAALAIISIWLAGLAGCATVSPQAADQRPFFQPEYARANHGRKTWFDRLFELDPSEINVKVSPEYTANPPAKVAVLPFTDQGSAQFIVDKVPLTFRDKQERAQWAWTDSQRLRRYMQGYLAGREFLVENLTVIDTVLAAHGIKDGKDLAAVPPQQLGQWLGVDAVMYGTVLHYESYYAFLIAGQQVSVEGRIVSTHDGNILVSYDASRERTNLMPAIDPLDMVLNSAQTLLDLRDIQIARSEDEACREIVIRIPASKHLNEQLVREASDMMAAQSSDLPLQPPPVADPPAPPHS